MKAKVNGILLHYTVEGESGPWVTLSHSLASDLRMWDPQVAALAARYRVLRFDTRGHGASEPGGTPSMADLAGDLAALHDHLGIARSHVVGLSLGGAIAQTYALAHPERVVGLVIADATSAYPPPTHAMWQERADQVAAGGMAAVAAGTLGRWFTPGWRERHPEVLARMEAMILATPPEGFVGAVAAIMGFDVSGRLSEIRAPTFVVVGAEDQALPPTHSERIAAGIPGARLTVIEAAAHIANVEQPERFTAALLDFLGEVDARDR